MLVIACSSDPKVISSTDNQVVVKAKPESFLDAYDLATKECNKNTRIAQYITDGTDKMEEVAFDCFDPNPEAEVVADAEAEEQAETIEQEEVSDETATEEITEEISEETSTDEAAAEEILEEVSEEIPSEEAATQ